MPNITTNHAITYTKTRLNTTLINSNYLYPTIFFCSDLNMSFSGSEIVAHLINYWKFNEIKKQLKAVKSLLTFHNKNVYSGAQGAMKKG